MNVNDVAISCKGVYSISFKEKDKVVIKFENEQDAKTAFEILKLKLPNIERIEFQTK